MARRVAAAIGILAFATVLAIAFARVPPSGAGGSATASSIVARVVAERHATDAVSAVTFDYRGIDTLGEEYILFVSIVGVATLLRKHSDEEEDDVEEEEEDEQPWRASDAVRVAAAGVVLAMVVVGVYLMTHGQVSPGGGFQGGIVLASAPIVVYLASNARTFCRLAPEPLVVTAESIGVAGYVVLGVVGVARTAPFLTNVLPLGQAGRVLSAGTILALNVTVGLAVAGGLVVLALAFMRDAIRRRMKGQSK